MVKELHDRSNCSRFGVMRKKLGEMAEREFLWRLSSRSARAGCKGAGGRLSKALDLRSSISKFGKREKKSSGSFFSRLKERSRRRKPGSVSNSVGSDGSWLQERCRVLTA